eukprot:TRINITY_DN8886_c0_g1_i1.p1 TRINITY_DN8886_c0_g1~~TRINITY_DN8886_c0_g1_i1.p1  ORF type:complete len:256 (-),score=74.76 TRINITY_DN8886_c0_g1_i1:199-966(-)
MLSKLNVSKTVLSRALLLKSARILMPKIAQFHSSGVRVNQTPVREESSAIQRYYQFQQGFPHWMHKTIKFVFAGFPLAFILSYVAPHWTVVPFDVILGIAVPIHAYVGTTMIIQDYCPNALKFPIVLLWTVFILLGAAGLLKLNLYGPGITEAIKSVWYSNKKGLGLLKCNCVKKDEKKTEVVPKDAKLEAKTVAPVATTTAKPATPAPAPLKDAKLEAKAVSAPTAPAPAPKDAKVAEAPKAAAVAAPSPAKKA